MKVGTAARPTQQVPRVTELDVNPVLKIVWPAMPTYVYEIVEADGSGGETFEAIQRISDPPLTEHPVTGKPCRRVIQPPFIGGAWSEGAMHKSVQDDKKLERLGFTKYVKSGDGTYEKRAGKGPDVISRDARLPGDSLQHLD